MSNKIHPILKAMIPLAKGISKTFGSNCEVVVHDLSHPETSIIEIFNNVVTERKIGEGIRDLVWNVLRSPSFKEDILANYSTIPYNNKIIKSTTVLVRDEKGKPIGAICMNFDLSSFCNVKNILEEFTEVNELSPPTDKKINIENSDVINILNHIIVQTIKEHGVSAKNMSREEKIKIVSFLDKKGVFKIKGASNWVSDKLNTSKSNLYNYLDIVRSKKV